MSRRRYRYDLDSPLWWAVVLVLAAVTVAWQLLRLVFYMFYGFGKLINAGIDALIIAHDVRRERRAAIHPHRAARPGRELTPQRREQLEQVRVYVQAHPDGGSAGDIARSTGIHEYDVGKALRRVMGSASGAVCDSTGGLRRLRPSADPHDLAFASSPGAVVSKITPDLMPA